MRLERNNTASDEMSLENSIKTNIEEIVDFDHINNIKVCRFKTKFHLGTGGLFRATINYSTNNLIKTKYLIIKRVYDANKSFEEHKFIFDKFKEMRVPQLLPKPYFFISAGNYIVMDYIHGISLSKLVLFKLMIKSNDSLKRIFKNLGSYLSIFHSITNNNFNCVSLEAVTKEILKKLKKSDLFSHKEKTAINKNLGCGVELLGSNYLISIARIYNDWTMRNFLIDNNNSLKLVDIDAMVHPEFPEYDLVWNDISTFLVNVESQTKYFPLINKKMIIELEATFLDGYNEVSDRTYSIQEINFLHYVAVLRFYLGMIERPLIEIYHKWPGLRFVKNLKKSLICGSGSVFAELF